MCATQIGNPFMALPSQIADKPNVSWLQSIAALTPDETRQRENQTRYGGADAQRPLDVKVSDAIGAELWEILAQADKE